MTDRLSPLSEPFLQALSPELRRRFEELPQLEETLARILEAARAAWPEITLPARRFISFLADRVPDDAATTAAIERLNGADLYLACGCASGDDAAVATFSTEHFPGIEKAIAALSAPRSLIEDVRQGIFQKLFVGDVERPAKIRHYAGEGDLGTWVRVVAVRQAIDLLRRAGREVPTADDRLPDLVARDEDPELRFLKQRYRVEFKEAFEAALATLSSRDRNVLRYQLVGSLTMEQIAELYQVNRSTVVRWLHKVREQLLTGTRSELSKRLRIDRAEFESVMRLINSQLHVSVKRLLERDE